MTVNLRLLGTCCSLLLAGAGCGSTPATRPEMTAPVADAPPPPAAPVPPAPVPVPPLISALLDSTRSAAALGTRLGLHSAAALRAFYLPACEPAWTVPADSLNANALAALALLARAEEHGLQAADYGAARLHGLRDSLAQRAGPALAAQRAGQQARLEVYLTDAVLTFMRDLTRGRLRAYTPSTRERAGGPAWQPPALLRAALASHTVPVAMVAGQPANREYRQLQRALAQWLRLPVAPDSLAQHHARYQKAAVNLERWRWELVLAGPEYVLINLPAFELQVVAHDSVLRRHRVVIGAPKTSTPTLSSTINRFTLAPDWHVPRSIATKEMLPRLKKDAGYLTRNNYALYDDRGALLEPTSINWAQVSAQSFAYTIRQSAGCENALGNIVFRFANPYSIYVHDTPLRQLFGRPSRALSHGCIRMEQPLELAAFLLRRDGRSAVLPSEEECANQPRPRDVRLGRPIPLYVRYATCTAENGHLRFYADVYGRDEVIRRGLFGANLAGKK